MAGLNWKLNSAHDFQMLIYRWALINDYGK